MVQRKRSRKRSQRKRSQRKKSRKRSQSGGGLFNWYRKVKREDCLVLAQNLIIKNKYRKPKQYIHDYSSEISKKSKITPGKLFKSGFFTLLTPPVAGILIGYPTAGIVSLNVRKEEFDTYLDNEWESVKSQYVDTEESQNKLERELMGKNTNFNKDLRLGFGLVTLAVIAGIVVSNIRGKSKQGKMILQCACDAWNAEYDEKISIKDIHKMIKEDKLSHKIMKDVAKAKTSDVKKAVEHDKLHFGR